MQREPFVAKGEKCVVDFNGRKFYVLIVQANEDGHDSIDFYMMEKGYSYVMFMIGLEPNSFWLNSQSEKDEFVLSQFLNHVDSYLQDIQKIETFE